MDVLTSTDILPQKRSSLLRLPHVVTERMEGGDMVSKRERAASLLHVANRHAPVSELPELHLEISWFL